MDPAEIKTIAHMHTKSLCVGMGTDAPGESHADLAMKMLKLSRRDKTLALGSTQHLCQMAPMKKSSLF